MKPAPLRIDRDRGADEPLIRMVIDRPHQDHIVWRGLGHCWVDLPADVHVSVYLGERVEGRSLPRYTVTTWANKYDRMEGDTP
jgi:hypothetical protein